MKRSRVVLLYITIISFFCIGYRNAYIPEIGNKLMGKRYHGLVRIIKHDTTFKRSDSPVVVPGYIVIRENATLTVEAGTKVLFKKKTGIVCYGRLVANGTARQKISFASEVNRKDSQWVSIMLLGDSSGKSVLKNCIISGAGGFKYGDPLPPGIHQKDPPKFKSAEFSINMFGGGAVVCYKASPTIEQCIFTNNGVSGNGGAVAVLDASSPIITNNVFTKNYASSRGGAIYSLNSFPTIEQNSFIQNKSSGKGGAIYLQNKASIQLKNNTFKGNSAKLGGAVFMVGYTSKMQKNLFYANKASAGGGVMAMNSAIEFTDTLFEGNTAVFSGGGVYLSLSQAKFVGCRLAGNSAKSGGMVFGIKSQAEEEGSEFLGNEPNNIEGFTSQTITN